MRPFPKNSRRAGADRTPPRLPRAVPGFSLTELLVVVAIMAIMASLTLPALKGLNQAGRFNASIGGLDETLNLARQTAVARNTYVFVALAVPASSADSLSALVVASADGTNPFASAWSGVVTLPDPAFRLVAPPKDYAQCQFIEAGVVTPRQIPTLPGAGATSQNGLSTDPVFTVATPAGPRTYSRVIAYAPSGQAYNGLTQVDFIEFGLQPGPAPTAEIGKDVALLRVAFVTGKPTLYRP